ncbi:hypothetical protein THAOC_05021, partial [Thalassiosira oceanica]
MPTLADRLARPGLGKNRLAIMIADQRDGNTNYLATIGSSRAAGPLALESGCGGRGRDDANRRQCQCQEGDGDEREPVGTGGQQTPSAKQAQNGRQILSMSSREVETAARRLESARSNVHSARDEVEAWSAQCAGLKRSIDELQRTLASAEGCGEAARRKLQNCEDEADEAERAL